MLHSAEAPGKLRLRPDGSRSIGAIGPSGAGRGTVRGRRGSEAMRMASQQLAGRWEAAFAGRTRVDVGGGLAAILALANVTDIISFSGGFPDPKTFPADVVARLMADLAAPGPAGAAHHERRHRGARSRVEEPPRPGRPGAGRGPDLPRRDHGVPGLPGGGPGRPRGR